MTVTLHLTPDTPSEFLQRLLRACGMPLHRSERRFPRVWPNTSRGAHRADVR